MYYCSKFNVICLDEKECNKGLKIMDIDFAIQEFDYSRNDKDFECIIPKEYDDNHIIGCINTINGIVNIRQKDMKRVWYTELCMEG